MRHLRLGAIAIALFIGSSSAYAVGICAAGSDAAFNNGETLTLVAGPETPCNVGGVIFAGFQVFAASGFAGSGFSMTVTETATGLNFSYTSLSAGKDVQLTFEVTPGLPGILLSSVTSSITEVVCADPFDPGCSTALGFGEITPGGSTLISMSPSGKNYIFMDIGGGSDLQQTVVPEPMTVSMIGLGLLSLGLVRRYRVKK